MLLPWPTREQRAEAIASAGRETEHSRDRAAHAAAVERDIRRMAETNHFAQTLAEQIMRGRRQ